MSRVFNASDLGANATGITTPGSAVYDNLQECSFAAWIYPTVISAFSVIFAQDAAGNYTADMDIMDNGGGAAFLDLVIGYTVTNAESTSSTTLPLNAWTHVAGTFSFSGDKKVHLYINGIEVSYSSQIVASGSRQPDATGGFFIGYDTFDGDGFTGNIAEFATWNKALTSGQVATLAASKTGASLVQPANLVGYWHLCGTMSPEPDVSGNGNSGVLSTNPPIKGADSPGFNCGGGPSPSPIPTHGTIFPGIYFGSMLTVAFANPSGYDLMQVVNEGNQVVWNLTASGVATTNPTNPTSNAILGKFSGSNFSVAFPNPYRLDVLQVIDGGGHVVFGVTYQGSAYTN